MAGDWIKMRGNLWDDPRVTCLCDLTNSGEATIVGALYWLWATADQHSQDGVMPGLTLRTIDRKTGVAGLGEALVSIGWIADNPDGVRLERFDEHNGESAKRRCVDAQRKANVRRFTDKCRNETEQNEDELRRIQELEKEKEKEKEKRREEKNKSNPAARAVTPVDLSVAMRKVGVQTQSADPRLIAFAEQGVTPEVATAACEEAKRSKPNETIGFGYVVKILERWAKDAKELKVAGASVPQKPAGAWWATESTIFAKGAELGINAHPGEQMHQLKGRIEAAISGKGKAPQQAAKPAAVQAGEPVRMTAEAVDHGRAAIRAAAGLKGPVA